MTARTVAATTVAILLCGCGLGDTPYGEVYAGETPAAPSWTADVQPRMDFYCTACHDPGSMVGAAGGWDFSSYEVVKAALPVIEQQAMVKRRMPPGDAPKLTAGDWATLARWEATGFPVSLEPTPDAR